MGIEDLLDAVDVLARAGRPYAWIFAWAPVPSTFETENVLSRIEAPVLDLEGVAVEARTGGPAVRLPSVSYWPPWHGQPKPAGCDLVERDLAVQRVLGCVARPSGRSPARGSRGGRSGSR